MIAAVRPVIERVWAANLDNIGAELISTGERSALPRVNGEVLTITGRFALALANADNGIRAVFAGFKAIAAALVNGKCLVGRVNFEDVVVIQVAHVDVERARGELKLGRTVIQIQKREPSI